MIGNKHAVLCHHQVRLYEVSSLINGRLIGFQRVFGIQAAGPAMRNNDWRRAVERLVSSGRFSLGGAICVCLRRRFGRRYRICRLVAGGQKQAGKDQVFSHGMIPVWEIRGEHGSAPVGQSPRT